MPEIGTSGSVGAPGGNTRGHPTALRLRNERVSGAHGRPRRDAARPARMAGPTGSEGGQAVLGTKLVAISPCMRHPTRNSHV